MLDSEISLHNFVCEKLLDVKNGMTKRINRQNRKPNFIKYLEIILKNCLDYLGRKLTASRSKCKKNVLSVFALEIFNRTFY